MASSLQSIHIKRDFMLSFEGGSRNGAEKNRQHEEKNEKIKFHGARSLQAECLCEVVIVYNYD
jgi:hypothetical protein